MVLGIISIALWVFTIFGYIIWNLNQKVAKLEDMATKQKLIIDHVTTIVDESNKQLNQIELTQAFQSDDQIGFFFKNLQSIQESLNYYLKNK